MLWQGKATKQSRGDVAANGQGKQALLSSVAATGTPAAPGSLSTEPPTEPVFSLRTSTPGWAPERHLELSSG